MKRSRSNTLRIAITVLLAAVLLASLAMPALAADNEDSPTWGVNMQRTRCIDSVDNIYQNYVTYNSTAQYCQLDSNLQSFSTPTCYTDSSGNDVVLAYGSEGENGYLYGLQESNNAISALWGGSIAFATQSAYEAAWQRGPYHRHRPRLHGNRRGNAALRLAEPERVCPDPCCQPVK